MLPKTILERKTIDSRVNTKNIVLRSNIRSISMSNPMHKKFVTRFDLFDRFVDLTGRAVTLV